MTTHGSILFATYATQIYQQMTKQGAQWFSGRVLDCHSRPRGRGRLEPHQRHCVLSFKIFKCNLDFLMETNTMTTHGSILFATYATQIYQQMTKQGAQWFSGRVLDCHSRPRGRGFEPHRRHCIVILEQETLVLVQPRKTRPCLSGRLLMGRKESNQTNTMKKQMAIVIDSKYIFSFPFGRKKKINRKSSQYNLDDLRIWFQDNSFLTHS